MLEKKIIFSSPLKGFISEPKPSLMHVPKPYKDLPLFQVTETQSTVKRCMPFLDALTTGYIIPFPIDIELILDEEAKEIKFNMHQNIPNEFYHLVGVTSHDSSQISKEMMNPKKTIDAIFKFSNPWKIKTPPGYSCLFVTPFNHVVPFDLITGIVDTDSYPLHIDFPFYWTHKLEKRFLIKEGSPMVMIFPFKRESWKIETKVCKVSHLKKSLLELNIFKKIADNYKTLFWKKKSYK